MSLEIVTRAQWGANYTSSYYTVGMAEKDEFFVHYHGGVPRYSVGPQVPREVESIHHGNGWSGVGYSFVVDQAGTIYEGRGWDGVCVACPDHNRRGIHVYVAVGGNQEATDAAKRSVVELRDEHRRLRALGGHSRPTDRLVHGDKYPTACAGPTLTPWVHAGYPLTNQEDDMPTPDDLWNQQLPKPGSKETEAAKSQLAKANVMSYRALNEVRALAAIVKAIAEKQLSPEELRAAVEAGVADAVDENYDVKIQRKEVQP